MGLHNTLLRDLSLLTTGDQTGMLATMHISVPSWPIWDMSHLSVMASSRSKLVTFLETLAGVSWLASVSILLRDPTTGEAPAEAQSHPHVVMPRRTAQQLTHKSSMVLLSEALTAMINTTTQGMTTFPTRWPPTTMLDSRAQWPTWHRMIANGLFHI